MGKRKQVGQDDKPHKHSHHEAKEEKKSTYKHGCVPAESAVEEAVEVIEQFVSHEAQLLDHKIHEQLHHLQHPEDVHVKVPKRPAMHCCGMALMNPYINGYDYYPTPFEEFANVITHAAPLAFCVYGLYLMLDTVSQGHASNSSKLIASWVFGVCMILLFTCSTLYHAAKLLLGHESKLTMFFYTLDTSMIYVYIAACYTPFLIILELGMDNVWGRYMSVFVWGLAVLGVTKNVFKLFQSLHQLFLYLVMGWVALLIMYPIVSHQHLDIMAVVHVLLGGAAYSIGCLFWSRDGVVPLSHAIWHMCVNVGSYFHFIAIHYYLISNEMLNPATVAETIGSVVANATATAA